MCVSSCYSSSTSRNVLKHEDLDGKIKTACLGSLLPLEHLERLENQHLDHKEVRTSHLQQTCLVLAKVKEPCCLHQDQVKLWLSAALKKEEESWLSGGTPELIDHYYFSPLAIDVIQVRDRGGLDKVPRAPPITCTPPGVRCQAGAPAQADGGSGVAFS